MMSYDQFFIH